MQVTWADFVASMVDFKRYKMEQYLWEVFRHFDRSNNGAIDRNDLAVIFSGGADPDFRSAVGLDRARIDAVLQRHARESEDRINFDESAEFQKFARD